MPSDDRSIAPAFLIAVAAAALAIGSCGCSSPPETADDAGAATPAEATGQAAMAARQVKVGEQSLQAGEYEQAVEQFTLALQSAHGPAASAPTGRGEAAIYHQRGLAYLQMGFPDTAAQDFTEAINLLPHHTASYERRAVAYLQLGDLYKALADATEAIRLEPRNAAAYHVRGLVYLRRSQFERSVADLEQTLAQEPALRAVVAPRLGEAYHGWGEELANEGSETAAAEKFARAEELNPEFMQRQRELASQSSGANQGEKLERTAAKPVVDDADESRERYLLGRERQLQGDLDQALVAFTESIALCSDQRDAYLRRGETLLALGFPDTALKDFGVVVNQGGASAEVHRLQAEAFFRLNHPHRAAMAATDALQFKPADAALYALRGRAYLQMENWERAIVDFNEATRREPKLGDALADELNAARLGLEEAAAKRDHDAASNQ